MSIVALSIHKEIANKNKHIKFMKFLLKASSIFEPKNYIQKLFSHNTVKYCFMLWSNPSKLLLNTIKEDKDFQSDLKIKIYGLNMFMGDIMPRVTKINETDYESRLVLAACVLEVMRFRAEVFEDDKPIGFHFDFDLKR